MTDADGNSDSLFSMGTSGGWSVTVTDTSTSEAPAKIGCSKVYVEILLEKNAMINTRPRLVRVGDGNLRMSEQLQRFH